MTHKDVIADNLATALLAGEWTEPSMCQRAAEALDGPAPWIPALVRDLRRACWSHPRLSLLLALIRDDPGFASDRQVGLGRVFWVPPTMQARADWVVPNFTAPHELARWLDLSVGQLEWFADCRGMESRSQEGPLRNYRYLWRESRSGKRRLLEAPRPRLKRIQRKILDDILTPIPTHDAAHAYRAGRSIVTFAAPHAGRRVVLRLDLRDFFPSIGTAQVRAIFRSAGYPCAVARLLAGLCTNTTPQEVWPAGSDFDSRRRFRSPHLPQGAPTSPALANLCAFRLDTRLSGLAAKGSATYTRYADDLAFSGDEELDRSAGRFRDAVAAIALDEGFIVNWTRRGSCRARRASAWPASS